ncbi:MAG: efflux transporter periplasmic adaptor subunit, partial [Gammaproteobacteria bacterium]|nr:efflux transporter periplasmic adaptor subunit [Gammaproteobacteria bacterium]
DLAFVDLPSAADVAGSGSVDGPLVTLSATQKGQQRTWNARIVRTEGVVDETNRVTYAVARIEDPYRLSGNANGDMPLPMGTFVAASIDGTTVDNVVQVPRSALRSNNQLTFVDHENRLRIGFVDIVRADARFAYIRDEGLLADRISITVLEAPISGMKVRTMDDPPEHSDESDDSAQLARGGTG